VLLGACLTAALLPLAARGGPPEAAELMDITEQKPKLKVLQDGKKHYLVLAPFGGSFNSIWFGDGKSFWLQRVTGGGSSGTESFDHVFWEPRVSERWKASVSFKDKKYEVRCEDRQTELTELPDDEAKAMLDSAKFFQVRWKRRAYALARDDRGTYYYVDKIREPESNKNFRLFVGPRGNLKVQKMVNVVSDSAGDIFATKNGELRLVLDKAESKWFVGKQERKLISLPIEDNAALIYSELGVYTGEPLGTPCDEL
jgi:hypothetical protein